jgi:hypothetical protein
VNASAEEGAGGQHHGARHELEAHLRHHPGDARAVDHQIVHRLLENAEVRQFAEQRAHCLLVQHPVGLGAGGAHRRPFARIQHAKLNAGAVGGASHDAAERVHLFHQMALADAADRRIAGHGAEGFDVVREQQSRGAHARAGRGRLGAGMTAANYDYVIGFGV